jgi:hypothetical protein
MRYLFLIIFLTCILAGCSSISTPQFSQIPTLSAEAPGGGSTIMTPPSQAIPTKASPAQSSPAQPSPTQPAQAQPSASKTPASTEPPGSQPGAITVNPPKLPVEQATTPLAGWQTYTSPAMGVTLDYPTDWSLVEQNGSIIFTSPQGAEIVLQEVNTSEVPDNNNQQCTIIINAYGLSINTCYDATNGVYSAYMQPKTGSAQQIMIKTTSVAALPVYTQMLSSLR